MGTAHLTAARMAKNDEFYTRIEDVGKELQHYKEEFRGQRVYLPCDDPERSAFWRFFRERMSDWHIRRLTATCCSPGKRAYVWHLDADSGAAQKVPIDGHGDFRSEPCRSLMRECDIIVTNPPFSLLRSFLAQTVQSGRRFLIVGTLCSLAYSNVFPLLQAGRLHAGINAGSMKFVLPGGNHRMMGNICWLTNMEPDVKRAPLPLSAVYKGNEAHYPRYANFNAINVDRLADIPADYDGMMGVPMTILARHCPEQFEIIDITHPFSPYADPRFRNIMRHTRDGRKIWNSNYGHGAFLPIAEKPTGGRTYYELDGDLYRQTFNRVLVRARKDRAV